MPTLRHAKPHPEPQLVIRPPQGIGIGQRVAGDSVLPKQMQTPDEQGESANRQHAAADALMAAPQQNNPVDGEWQGDSKSRQRAAQGQDPQGECRAQGGQPAPSRVRLIQRLEPEKCKSCAEYQPPGVGKQCAGIHQKERGTQ